MIRIYLALLTVLASWRDAAVERLELLDNEDGLTTTEMAVVTFLLVGGAIVVTGIVVTAATNNANNIPVPVNPGG